MEKLICELDGDRGRILKVYDTKVVIITKKKHLAVLPQEISLTVKKHCFCAMLWVSSSRKAES